MPSEFRLSSHLLTPKYTPIPTIFWSLWRCFMNCYAIFDTHLLLALDNVFFLLVFFLFKIVEKDIEGCQWGALSFWCFLTRICCMIFHPILKILDQLHIYDYHFFPRMVTNFISVTLSSCELVIPVIAFHFPLPIAIKTKIVIPLMVNIT